MLSRDNARIVRELKAATRENTQDLCLIAKDGNIRTWLAMIKAPDDTPFEGHFYQIELRLPDSYPIRPPKARFLTPIFHPNIHFKTGKVCLNILKGEWLPAWGVQSVCRAISALLARPEPDSPLNTLAGNLLRSNDEAGYYSMAAMYARKWAPTTNLMLEQSRAKDI
jgi:peroxin-4